MPSYKEGKWAVQILDAQQESGAWRFFHTLNQPSGRADCTACIQGVLASFGGR